MSKVRIAGFIIVGLVFLSVFLWAAFDVAWWVETGPTVRGLALLILHFVVGALGVFCIAFDSLDLLDE